MLHRGQRITFQAALPIILRVGKSAKMLRAAFGCRGKGPGHPMPESDVPDHQWSVCPLCTLMDGPQMRQVITLDRLAKVAPLAGWPDRYAAWLVAGLLTIRAERGEA